MLRTRILLPTEEAGDTASVIERMRECEEARRLAARHLLHRRLYIAMLCGMTAVFCLSAFAFRTPVQISLLGVYGLLTGFMYGRMPWAKMRLQASRRESWFAMSIPLLTEAARRADGLERIMIGGVAARLDLGIEIAPTSHAMRLQHLSDVVDVMESIQDHDVLRILVAHVRLAAAGMGADLETRKDAA